MSSKQQVKEESCMIHDDIVTPINHELLIELLQQARFDPHKISKLQEGFESGFDIGYRGPAVVGPHEANNIPFTVGNEIEMWNKIMNEVEMQRYAGPYTKENLPFRNYLQSPIGLVPKAGNKTRLIFHLSHDFSEEQLSLNAHTPKDLATVRYKDLDHAIQVSMQLLERLGLHHCLFYGKSDLTSAFRLVPVKISQRHLLLMRAHHPVTLVWNYFVDKCLPFGSSISCAHFQLFSDALAAIFEHEMGIKVTNYLDDFLFTAGTEDLCNKLVRHFLHLCERLKCPVAHDKTEWASLHVVFLGILLDGSRHVLAVPQDKREKTLMLIKQIQHQKKVTIKDIQKLTGLLNFLQKVIVPGRTFTRRMYDKLKMQDLKGRILKHYHHIRVDEDFRKDCKVWEVVLSQLYRPFVDFKKSFHATTLKFLTDASLNENYGFGAVFDTNWTFGRWGKIFIKEQKPSIAFLELYALCAGILTWSDRMRNMRVVIFCDNESVVNIVNKMTSKCPKCMKLVRILVYNSILYNRRVFVRHIKTELNVLADSLSRMNF